MIRNKSFVICSPKQDQRLLKNLCIQTESNNQPIMSLLEASRLHKVRQLFTISIAFSVLTHCKDWKALDSCSPFNQSPRG